MANHPVKIRQGKIDDLIQLYQNAYKKVVTTMVDATEAGKIQKARTMARINADLSALGVDLNEWASTEIPQYYLDGANVAIQDLRKLGVDISTSGGMSAINQQAIRALTDEVALAFAESITAISRNARRVLSDALKQQLNFIIADGKLTGDALATVADAVAQRLKDEGLSALVDKAGRSWTFDNYAEMLVRTKAVEARNQGLSNRMLENGYDLVQVSDNGSSHPACADWEGKILSLTGETDVMPDGTPVDGTVAEAESEGLFHPNCEHAINVIVPDLADQTEAYDNPYDYRD